MLGQHKNNEVKVLPKRLELRCDSEGSKSKLQSFLTENLTDEIAVEDNRPTLVKMTALNVPDEVSKQAYNWRLRPRKIKAT